MVAQQTTEFAHGPLFGNQLKAAVAGAAIRTGDVGLLHVVNMRLRRNRSSPVPVQRSKAQQAALSDKRLNLKPASRNRTKKAIVNGAARMLAEKFFLVLGHKPHLPRREPEGGKHLAAHSDQTAEREREVSSARSTTLRMALVKGSGEVRS
jgi:hypothetical protein